MLQTTNYKFKKPQLTDSPPNITSTNDNWDITDAELKRLSERLQQAENGAITDQDLADFKQEVSNTYATKNELEGVKQSVSNFKQEVSNTYATKNELENVKQSVSNGKKLIAEAITDKKVQTSATASFQTIADNIRKIRTGMPSYYLAEIYKRSNTEASKTFTSNTGGFVYIPDFGASSSATVDNWTINIDGQELVLNANEGKGLQLALQYPTRNSYLQSSGVIEFKKSITLTSSSSTWGGSNASIHLYKYVEASDSDTTIKKVPSKNSLSASSYTLSLAGKGIVRLIASPATSYSNRGVKIQVDGGLITTVDQGASDTALRDNCFSSIEKQLFEGIRYSKSLKIWTKGGVGDFIYQHTEL